MVRISSSVTWNGRFPTYSLLPMNAYLLTEQSRTEQNGLGLAWLSKRPERRRLACPMGNLQEPGAFEAGRRDRSERVRADDPGGPEPMPNSSPSRIHGGAYRRPGSLSTRRPRQRKLAGNEASGLERPAERRPARDPAVPGRSVWLEVQCP